MKTTVDLPAGTLRRAKLLAKREGTTLRKLTHEALDSLLAERSPKHRRKLSPVTFSGEGLSKKFRDSAWSGLRDEIYGGRGA